MDPLKQTLDEYLGLRGLSSPISDYILDKLRLPHGQTLRQEKAMQREATRAQNAYSERRAAAIEEYRKAVAEGRIIPKTLNKIRIQRANGHPDNESTWAARRMCEKHGIDWRGQTAESAMPAPEPPQAVKRRGR
jgi:hypothetical protein